MAMSRNISVSEASRPKLPRHARLKFDETRQVWVILAPERVLAPDEIAVEVLHARFRVVRIRLRGGAFAADVDVQLAEVLREAAVRREVDRLVAEKEHAILA